MSKGLKYHRSIHWRRAGLAVWLVLLLALLETSTLATLASAQSQGSGQPLPRFVSLRATEANMRTGPSGRYPIAWIYKRRTLPLEVVAEFDTWRKVRDWRGSEGWMHRNLLSSFRSVIVTGGTRLLRASAEDTAAPVAKLEEGVIGAINSCPKDSAWCQITSEGYSGWLKRSEVWGIYPDEAVKQ